MQMVEFEITLLQVKFMADTNGQPIFLQLNDGDISQDFQSQLNSQITDSQSFNETIRIKLKMNKISESICEDKILKIIFFINQMDHIEKIGETYINVSFYINNALPQIIDKLEIENNFDEEAYVEIGLKYYGQSNNDITEQFEQSTQEEIQDDDIDSQNNHYVFSSYSQWRQHKQNIATYKPKINYDSQLSAPTKVAKNWEDSLRGKVLKKKEEDKEICGKLKKHNSPKPKQVRKEIKEKQNNNNIESNYKKKEDGGKLVEINNDLKRELNEIKQKYEQKVQQLKNMSEKEEIQQQKLNQLRLKINELESRKENGNIQIQGSEQLQRKVQELEIKLQKSEEENKQYESRLEQQQKEYKELKENYICLLRCQKDNEQISSRGKDGNNQKKIDIELCYYKEQLQYLRDDYEVVKKDNEIYKIQNDSLLKEAKITRDMFDLSQARQQEIQSEQIQLQQTLKQSKQDIADIFNCIFEFGGSQLLDSIENKLKLRQSIQEL